MAQARRNNSWVCQIQGQGRGMPRGEAKLKVPAGSQLGSRPLVIFLQAPWSGGRGVPCCTLGRSLD